MIVDYNVYIEHFGVKGMQWGVTTVKPGSKDVSLKKGQKVYNISGDKARDISGKVYTAHLKDDVLNYRAAYAKSLVLYRGADSVFTNSFTVNKSIKAAGRDTQVEAFKKLWETDKEGVVKVLALTEADAKVSAAFIKRGLKIDRDDAYTKRYMNKGEKWVEQKGVDQFVMRLGTDNRVIDKKQDAYFKYLSQRGYNAVVDLNDVNNYGSKEPLLIFKGKQTLGNQVAKEFTLDDVKRAEDTYLKKKAYDEYNVDD